MICHHRREAPSHTGKTQQARQSQEHEQMTFTHLKVFGARDCGDGARACADVEDLWILQPWDLDVCPLGDNLALDPRSLPRDRIWEPVEHDRHLPAIHIIDA